MTDKPTLAIALFLVAGMSILLGGYTAIMDLTEGLRLRPPLIYVVPTALGFISGIVVLGMGILLYARPKHHISWGIVGGVFSFLSVGTLFTVFAHPEVYVAVGVILGAAGSGLGIMWRPSGKLVQEVPPQPSPYITRQRPSSPPEASAKGVHAWIREKEVIIKVRCPYCDKLYDETLDVCPYCGGPR